MARLEPSLQPHYCGRALFRLRPVLLAIAGAFATTGALAADERNDTALEGQSYVVDVPVVSAEPIEVTRRVERPEKTCELVRESGRYARDDRRYSSYERDSRYDRQRYDRQRYERERRGERGSVGAQVLGGLIGGAIGNQFGGGNGKKALTIAGALIGSSIARGDRSRYHDRHVSEYREIEPEYQCRTTTRTREVTQVTGYDVTYRYNDTLYNRRMEYDPGDTLELRVRAVPDIAPVTRATTLTES